MVRFPGYPVDPPIRPLVPRPYKRDELPQTPSSVANPGGYISLVERMPFSIGAGYNYQPMVTMYFWSNQQYNVIEVDCECIASATGWVVPDKFAIGFSPADPTGWTNNPVNPPNVLSPLLGGYQPATGYIPSDYVFMPPKLAVTPVVGDPTNSYSLWGTSVFRIRGVNPAFSKFLINAWLTNSTSVADSINAAQQPFIRVRAWYDPLIQETLTVLG